MSESVMPPSVGLYYDSAPQVVSESSGEQTWITRSANVVVVVSKVNAQTVLVRENNPDEYMLLLPAGVKAMVQSGDQRVEAKSDSLTILPPGASRIEILNAGTITRVFSVRAKDLADLASNAEVYKNGAASVDPLEDWPMPVGGYKIRSYDLPNYCDPKIFGRLFRSRNLMINVFEPKDERRDPGKLTPHSHANFEQISLALEGTFIHHLRTPWGPNSHIWEEDQHLEVHSPSTLVIPTNLIHTTQSTGAGVNWLVDVFGPPRLDFSSQPGVVRNADEYPMPS